MKLQLQFKEKHLCYVGKNLTNQNTGEWFEVMNTIVTALKAPGIQPDDLVTVEVEHLRIVEIYTMLGFRTERESSVRNSDIKTTLLPQLLSLAQGADADQASAAAEVLTLLQSIDATNLAAIDNSEAIFRQWALNT